MTSAWRSRLLMVAPLLAVGFLAVAPTADDGPTVCPFALTTGVACPGCGMTRAAGYLLRGDLSSALRYHPLVILIAVQAMAGWGWWMLRRSETVRPMSTRITNAIFIGTGVSLVVVWLLRLWAGSLPPV
ncbi:MAG: DUF2752 domain-containing protein [Acidimicrobiia bacterium]